MTQGISLHVGINKASSAFPNAATLTGAENDAREMEKIAAANLFTTRDLLLGSDATYGRVTTKIRTAAKALHQGDIFLFTFAGHGFQRPDAGDSDENDRKDETILLYDFELFDDVMRRELLPLFRPGVRVLGILDSCHSESAFAIPHGPTPDLPPPSAGEAVIADLEEAPPIRTPDGLRSRTARRSVGEAHFAQYGEFYESTLLPLVPRPILASVLLLAACQANSTTPDGDPNGVYTAAMLKALKDFDPSDYDHLVTKIKAVMNRPIQTPTIEFLGEPPNFRTQRPFTV
jgi:hypothetical protein